MILSAMPEESRDELITILKDLADRLGSKSVARHQFLRESGVSERTIQRLFGSYNSLVQAAGLEPMRFPSAESKYADTDLLAEVVRVLRLPDSRPTRVFFERNANVSASVCERRFGGWLNVVRAAAAQLDKDEDGQVLARLEQYVSPESQVHVPADSPQGEATDTERDAAPPADSTLAYEPRSEARNLFGDFINFRGLQHAPVNEQGVVFLFGMIARELGYVVEIVRAGFPDCEAKRQVKGRAGKWERVRIEFEFESRTFRSHGHDPDQCDVIVCWEHNWPDCPLEVVELRGVMEGLANKV